jgi:hypothetical protein
MSSISIMGTVRVSSVKFCSICLRALSASPAGGFPATATPLAAAAAASGRGRRLFRAKLAGRTGPTSAMQHKGHPSETLSSKKHDIYLKNIKITYTNKKTVQEETYLSLLAPRLEALASLDPWRNQSPRMGSPLSWVSAATAMQRNHR